jgi:hypothetical protein
VNIWEIVGCLLLQKHPTIMLMLACMQTYSIAPYLKYFSEGAFTWEMHVTLAAIYCCTAAALQHDTTVLYRGAYCVLWRKAVVEKQACCAQAGVEQLSPAISDRMAKLRCLQYECSAWLG